MKIEFSGNHEYCFDTRVVSFEAIIDGSRLILKVSDQAIKDNFPNTGDSMEIFQKNQATIQEIARRLIKSKGYVIGQPFLICSRDILIV
jgi:hypothetical protein